MASRQEVELLLGDLKNDPNMKEYKELFDFISEDLDNPDSELTPCQVTQEVLDLAGKAFSGQNIKSSKEDFSGQYEKNCHNIAEMLYNYQK